MLFRQQIQKVKWIVKSGMFLFRFANIRHRRKILYALTSPPYWRNVGDHAQNFAIRNWLRKHFGGFPIIETDIDQTKNYLWALKWLVQPQDIIFLKGGGNMGDRGIWSEESRRLLVANFPDNHIISLPQTIYFSDTVKGRSEKEKTRRIYGEHAFLTIIARDFKSEEIARDLFPRSRIFCIPDFVLSIVPQGSKAQDIRKTGPLALICLRKDNESRMSSHERIEIMKRCPYKYITFDTDIGEDIRIGEERAIVERTLELFDSVDIVITDRFHGLVFSILCKKPCVVLPSIDHKITAGIKWFEKLSFVVFAHSLEEIPELASRCLSVGTRESMDWNAEYFDKLPGMLSVSEATFD